MSSMSKAKCCVPGCLESGGSDRVLHGFPNPEKEPDRFRSWVFSIGGDIVGLSNEYIYTHRRVCHSHFEGRYCCRFNRISKLAVPTLNLIGLSTIPRFTWDERRPLRNTLNWQEDVVPCTSQDVGVLPKESQETAVILLFFDKLFDSVNGSYAKKEKHGKPYLGPVRPSSIHHGLWNEAKKCLKEMKFVTKSGKEECVPTLRNWVMTLEGVELLTKKLKDDYDISSVWMRHLNQDPLENFFGAIRSHGCRNTNPTPERFESAFATLLVNNLTSVHAPGANCEKDYGEALHALVINEDCKANTTSQYEVDMDDVMNINLTAVASKNDPKIIAPLTYVTGYFVRESKRKISKNCKTCRRLMQDDEGQHEYIKKREYAGKKWLQNPSSAMIEVISNIQDICNL